ncbi:MAG: carboxypeptidase regulatory-like domain-containing protein [Holophagaceae bacterium]|nr:carboxypeptidase regulatory-like domain-containing protein [Holophagaceae bacterium]
MRNLFFCAIAITMPFSLSAQSTGRMIGKVTDSAGKPIPTATLVLKRIGTNQSREIKVNSNGSYLQVGLGPYEYDLTVTAKGYVEHKEVVKIPLGEALTKEIVLITPAEATNANPQAQPAGRESAIDAVSAYNEAGQLFNDKKYSQAMEISEQAVSFFSKSIEESSGEAPSEVQKHLLSAKKLYALSMFETGNADKSLRSELWLKAEPVLLECLEKMPGDSAFAQCLAEIAGMKGDTEAASKYIDMVEKIDGPIAGNSYNRGVDLYNAGKTTEALPHFKRAIELDPKMPEAYYLLAMCELGEGDFATAKTNLQKYLAMAPKGKFASEAQEILADPAFKSN